MFVVDEESENKNKDLEKERALKLANFYKEEGLYEDAIKNYEMFIFLSKEQVVDFHIFKDLAICYSLNGFTAEAINNLKKALKIKNEDTSVMYLLAQMYEQARMFEEAEEYYRMITKYDDKMPSVYYQLGEIAYKRNDVEEAIINWSKVVEIEPTNSYAFYLLGALFYYKKEFKSAEKNFKLALKNGFKSAQLYHYLARVYTKFNEKEKAKANYLIALDRDKLNSIVYENYLEILDEKEIFEEKSRLDKIEDYKVNRYRLGLLHKHLSEYQEAKEVFDELLQEKMDAGFSLKVEEQLNEIYNEIG